MRKRTAKPNTLRALNTRRINLTAFATICSLCGDPTYPSGFHSSTCKGSEDKPNPNYQPPLEESKNDQI